jgi:hypothetical protein
VGPKIYPFGRVLEAAFSFTGLYIFAKFRLEKYDFDPYKGGFLMGKMVQIRQISNLKNSKLPAKVPFGNALGTWETCWELIRNLVYHSPKGGPENLFYVLSQ